MIEQGVESFVNFTLSIQLILRPRILIVRKHGLTRGAPTLIISNGSIESNIELGHFVFQLHVLFPQHLDLFEVSSILAVARIEMIT